MISLCDNWEFTRNCSEAFLSGRDDSGCAVEQVRIPHNIAEVPLQYADPEDYSFICGYRRSLNIVRRPGMRYILRFDGAAHIAEVFVNGRSAAEHRCGYTAFDIDITDLFEGDSCLIGVRLDSTENPEIPPFGFVIDFLTYGGIYRPVWLDERPECRIEDIFVITPSLTTAHVEITLAGSDGRPEYDLTITDSRTGARSEIFPRNISVSDLGGRRCRIIADIEVPGALPWSFDDPVLYTLSCVLHNKNCPDDSSKIRFGFRTAVFTAEGFFLNGKKTFLTGLNRHQNFPYVGYAATDSLQRLDAEILKNELHVNAVRTSHYPQSQAFIDACDELGLAVFTEIPGWQHIGGSDGWREQVLVNTREMVLQYRNHPSIILWGVRINESVDCDELYEKTNRIAHELDPSRATSGVRYLEKSHLLEDVYAFNDFSYSGEDIRSSRRRRPAAKPRRKVTPVRDKAFLISECNGHMFPTRPFDRRERCEEQALRHAAVLNDAIADGGHAGCFEWCMFDYPTHKDFGSGDRVCYHGVTDAFRNPKIAAAVYASQSDVSSCGPVLEIGSSMDIGDYNAGRLESCYVFTNSDRVRLYKNGDFVTELAPSAFSALKHGPLCVDDTIGCLLETNEGFTGRKEKLLHKALTAAARYGIAGLPLPDLLRMGWCMLRYGLSYSDGVELFGRYVGNWGGESVVWTFEGISGGKPVIRRDVSPSSSLHIEVLAGTEAAAPGRVFELNEDITYDMALIRIRILDSFNNPASYAAFPVHFEASGCIELIGPDTVVSAGGACGTIVRTNKAAGPGTLKISAGQAGEAEIGFVVR